MPFWLKNAQAEFQKVMDTIIRPLDSFAIAYIDDVMIFSPNVESHFQHIEALAILLFFQSSLIYG